MLDRSLVSDLGWEAPFDVLLFLAPDAAAFRQPVLQFEVLEALADFPLLLGPFEPDYRAHAWHHRKRHPQIRHSLAYRVGHLDKVAS